MKKIIKADRSVIVACDVNIDQLDELVDQTYSVPGIGGYKIGLSLVSAWGLRCIMNKIRSSTMELPVIYDHQKAGTDIPKLGSLFAKRCSFEALKGVILFPFGGAATEREWIKACKGEGLTVLVGGHMTQPEFLVSEGGFIADDAPERIFKIAMEYGVRDFVVPGNKVEFVKKYRKLFVDELGEGEFTLYAPGFVGQGGVITETGKVAGKNWHAIVGSAIYTAKDKAVAAQEITSQIF